MSEANRSTRALEAGLLARGRDREAAERALAAAGSERRRLMAEIDTLCLTHKAAKDELAAVWNSETNVARLRLLREGGTAQVAEVAEGLRRARLAGARAESELEAARKSLAEASAAEEAIRRVLEARRAESRRVLEIRSEEDAE